MYMARYTSRSRIIPIILIIVIMVIAIVALVSLARAIFFSGGQTQNTAQVDTSRDSLLNTAEGHKVRMVVRGPIVADEKFNSYQITITPSSRTLTTYRGYLYTQIDSINLGNNVAAYDQFVHALDKANLPVGTAFPKDKDSTLGICATGRVYEYEIIDGDTTVKRLWTSTCKGSPGSLKASADQLTNLFVAQIPDANNALGKIRL